MRNKKSVHVLRSFQGHQFVGVLFGPPEELRVFQIHYRSATDCVNVTDQDRILALVVRCELLQPSTEEMDTILQDIWDAYRP